MPSYSPPHKKVKTGSQCFPEAVYFSRRSLALATPAGSYILAAPVLAPSTGNYFWSTRKHSSQIALGGQQGPKLCFWCRLASGFCCAGFSINNACLFCSVSVRETAEQMPCVSVFLFGFAVGARRHGSKWISEGQNWSLVTSLPP